MPRPTYNTVLTAAISDLAQHGFDSAARVAEWQRRLRQAAEDSLPTESELTAQLERSLNVVYGRMVEKGGIAKRQPGVERYTIQKLTPQLRLELQRRLLASADLIKLNRRQAIEKTLQRFSGWGTSLPAGGSRTVDRRKVKKNIAKPVAQVKFEARRVAIDQGAKLVAAVNDIVAMDGGAIAARWHSQWRRPGYQYREPHKDRDEHVYIIRGSWAHKAGLVKPGKYGYKDEIDQPAELPFCSCYWEFLFNLRDLPEECLTEKGIKKLAEVREMLSNALREKAA